MLKKPKARVAFISGPSATIQNTPPLVTSNKARTKHGLPERRKPDGSLIKFDALRSQRLAVPAKVYVEQFSAHPLEVDAAELYGPPDGYIDKNGSFSTTRRNENDRPVFEIELKPDDGLYPLPYMARQADGTPWEDELAFPGAPDEKARQTFLPDGSFSFEEIDRLALDSDGTASLISSKADVDFYRITPAAGFKKGLAQPLRKDTGDGDITPEQRGRHFNSYKPYHLASVPSRPALARITNQIQAVCDSGKYDGLIWTQGSPQIEETVHWFNLLINTKAPICGTASQRTQGQISADGPKNIVDSISYIQSGVWKDSQGHNRCGTILVQEQQFFAAREVTKVDARPGGYRAAGGHGGVLGQISYIDKISLMYVPSYKHTYLSETNITKLPETANAVRRRDDKLESINITIKDSNGRLTEEAIPSVSIIKDGGYFDELYDTAIDDSKDLIALIEHKLSLGRLSGFVTEGLTPYGRLPSSHREALLLRATFSGIPIVRVGRGAPEGFADHSPFAIAGSNLTAIKARLTLMACLMKFGALPIAENPSSPTKEEREKTIAVIARYQDIFDSH